MRTSGILEWKEDFAYLNAQMTKEQPGHLGSVDERQLRKDQHKEQQRLKEAARLEKEERDRLEEDERKRSFYKETTRETEEVEALDVNENDLTYEERKTKKKKKIDVMGAIAQCSDARHLSVRDKTFVAASVSNAFGIGIEETNISKTTAWRRGGEERVKKAAEIKDNFSCPNKVCVHWDGKTLQKKGKIKSNRVAVHISGLGSETEQVQKLLGIPEAPSGGGADEFSIVDKALEKWGVSGEAVVGMVFDTTASNTGKNNGCCR